jgi:PAS domain S-box-containing protein
MIRSVTVSFPKFPTLRPGSYTCIGACSMAVVCYLLAEFVGLFVLRPQMIWPVWPGCAFLLAILLLTPRKIWPAFLAAGIAGFFLYDLRVGLPIRSSALLELADMVEILIAALGVSYALGSAPRLNSINALAKYSLFAVILAPIFSASLGATSYRGDYAVWWKISFLTDALALLMVTPAILSWAIEVRIKPRHSRTYYGELLALLIILTSVECGIFVAPGGSNRPGLLYSLVPFLLWAALRFGVLGVSTSLNIVAFLSIWGAVHGRGPFTGAGPLENVLTFQIFFLTASSSFMVLAALVEEHKQTLHESRESESRFRLVANTAPVMIWMSRPDKLYTYFNQPWLDFTGRPLEEELGNGWVDSVHSEDQEVRLDKYAKAFDLRESFRMEYRLRRHDGQYRWVLDLGTPRVDPDGTFAGYIGSAIDVTEQKLAKDALSNVNRRLIEAQEEERSWIARELHDDINQRVALMAVNLATVNGDVPTSAPKVKHGISEVEAQLRDLGNDIHALSHRLHSSKLEYLGLAAAAAAFCREFSERQGVEIDFQCDAVPKTLRQEISVCLFRVLQEALQNATKHSGSRHFQVFLKGSLGEINLAVSDSGVGFDSRDASKGPGLGITSMLERLKLVEGELSIESQPHQGANVHARVPLSPALKPVMSA